MSLLNHALRAGRGDPPASTSAPARATRSMLVAGGGGALGSAVLEALLAGRHFAPVRVLTTRALGSTMQGLAPVLIDAVEAESADTPLADTALVVFDRARHANGRELAFFRPEPQALASLAATLHRRGVRSLVVVLPHAPSQLPAALKAGLANLDEHAVAALGFEQLVFVRSAQAPSSDAAGRWMQRMADGLLAQMRIMVATTHQPVRAAKVARFVVELARQLAACPPGTRVAPPELVWQAAQVNDPAALVQAWLAGRELPPLNAPRMRL